MSRWKMSVRDAAVQGTPIRCRVPVDLGAALVAEGRRRVRNPGFIASEILAEWWWMDEGTRAMVEREAERAGVSAGEVVAQVVGWWAEDCREEDAKKPA